MDIKGLLLFFQVFVLSLSLGWLDPPIPGSQKQLRDDPFTTFTVQMRKLKHRDGNDLRSRIVQRTCMVGKPIDLGLPVAAMRTWAI